MTICRPLNSNSETDIVESNHKKGKTLWQTKSYG